MLRSKRKIFGARTSRSTKSIRSNWKNSQSSMLYSEIVYPVHIKTSFLHQVLKTFVKSLVID